MPIEKLANNRDVKTAEATVARFQAALDSSFNSINRLLPDDRQVHRRPEIVYAGREDERRLSVANAIYGKGKIYVTEQTDARSIPHESVHFVQDVCHFEERNWLWLVKNYLADESEKRKMGDTLADANWALAKYGKYARVFQEKSLSDRERISVAYNSLGEAAAYFFGFADEQAQGTPWDSPQFAGDLAKSIMGTMVASKKVGVSLEFLDTICKDIKAGNFDAAARFSLMVFADMPNAQLGEDRLGSFLTERSGSAESFLGMSVSLLVLAANDFDIKAAFSTLVSSPAAIFESVRSMDQKRFDRLMAYRKETDETMLRL